MMMSPSIEKREGRRGYSVLQKRFLLLGTFLAIVAFLGIVHASPPVDQAPLVGNALPSSNSPVLPPGLDGNKGRQRKVKAKKRKLYGRFLHITGQWVVFRVRSFMFHY